MKTLISIAGTVIFALTSITAAFAAPAPATYNDAAWSNFIEQGKTNTLPAGYPNGPGAVSRLNGTQGFWPNHIQITSPFDLHADPDLVFSKHAVQNELYYASESMKLFLHAVSVQAKKISKKPNFKIPIYSLFHSESAAPYDIQNDKVSSVNFGLFTMENGVSSLTPDARIVRGDILAGLKNPQSTPLLRHKKYQEYLSQRRNPCFY